jgi:hypothetical protein
VTDIIVMPGFLELFNDLYKNGHLLGIVTNSNKTVAIKIIELLGIRHKLSVFITSNDCIFGKPNKEPYEKAINMLEIANNKVFIFEDSKSGYLSAKQINPAMIIGVNFNFTPSNPYYSLNYNNNGGTIYYYECNFINGSRVGNYSGSQDLIATMPDWYRGMVNIISTISPASLAASTYKSHYNNIISAVEFIPAYTLLPISDDSNPDNNSIVLENTSNITSIPNFEFKL